MHEKMEHRIRLGSDGNGVFVALFVCGPITGHVATWRIVSDIEDLAVYAQAIDDTITLSDFRDAIRHLGAEPCADCDGTGSRQQWPHGTCPTCKGACIASERDS